jgi:hypothetical protein
MGGRRRRRHVSRPRLDEGRRCHCVDRCRRRERIFTCRFQGPCDAVGESHTARGRCERQRHGRRPITPGSGRYCYERLIPAANFQPPSPCPCLSPKPRLQQKKSAPTHPAPDFASGITRCRWGPSLEMVSSRIYWRHRASQVTSLHARVGALWRDSPVTRYSSSASIFLMSPFSMENPPISPFSAILAFFTLFGSGT